MTLDKLIETLQEIKKQNPEVEADIQCEELFVMFPYGYKPPADIKGAEKIGGGYLVDC